MSIWNGLSKKESGFTLIEIIVALVIFSVITIACVRALTFILDYVEREQNFYQDQSHIQRTWNIVFQDLLHMRPRTERDRLGGVKRAYQTDIDEYLLLFTRGGLPPITGSEGGLQRVAYSVDEDGQFIRWTWPSMDMYNDEEPNEQVLMGGVSQAEFWQLNASNEYEANWPPLNEQLSDDALPRMIRLVIEMETGDRIERIIPGLQMARASRTAGGNGGGGGGGNRDDNQDRESSGNDTQIDDDGGARPEAEEQ